MKNVNHKRQESCNGNISLSIILLASLLWVIVSLASTQAFPAGGDLGGGGMATVINRDFKVNPQLLHELKKERELRAARELWLQNLSPEEHERILNNVFKNMIVPQITAPSASN